MKSQLWNLVDRALKMFEQSGYTVVAQDPTQSNPVKAWMSDARLALETDAPVYADLCVHKGCQGDRIEDLERVVAADLIESLQKGNNGP